MRNSKTFFMGCGMSRDLTRSKPQPARVLELFKKKPVEAAADKVYRELQDGTIRELLRLVLHHGVRGSKPDPPLSQTPSAEVVSLQEELSFPYRRSFSNSNMRLAPWRYYRFPFSPRSKPPAVN